MPRPFLKERNQFVALMAAYSILIAVAIGATVWRALR